MEVKVFEGKDLEETKKLGLDELGLEETDTIILTEEEKGGLLKKKTYRVKIFSLKDIQDYIKEYLKSITTLMGLDVSFEAKIRDQQIYIKMYSDNNSILIGKDGKTLSSLTFIVKQVLANKYNIYPHILLDVENYKEKKEKSLIILAKKVAREVFKTKVEVKLDNMNSYERRIIHNALSNNDKISTISEGEEPNRHIVIKYVGEK